MLFVYVFASLIIGALIGWITNILAIYLIFRPFSPIKIPLLNFYIQGLIPKRQKELAQAIGEIVERELFSAKDILNQLDDENIQQRLASRIKLIVRDRIAAKIPAIVPSALKLLLLDVIEQQFDGEFIFFIKNSSESLQEEIQQSIPVAKIVSQKITSLSMADLERLVLIVAKKELKHIEYLGAVLGGIIGLIQGTAFYMINNL